MRQDRIVVVLDELPPDVGGGAGKHELDVDGVTNCTCLFLVIQSSDLCNCEGSTASRESLNNCGWGGGGICKVRQIAKSVHRES